MTLEEARAAYRPVGTDDARRHWDATVRMIEEEVPRYTRMVETAISAQIRQAANRMEAGGEATFDDQFLQSAYATLYYAVAVDFARRTYAALESAGAFNVRADVIMPSGTGVRREALRQVDDATEEAWNRLVIEFLQDAGANRVRLINETTTKFIRAIITEAADEGVGPREAARLLRKRWEGVSKARAERIARTELLGASNRGSLMGADTLSRDLGLTMKKTWLAAFVNTRESHAAAHGQTVALDASFDVGGASMRYPGDQIAPPAETCNCMCTMTYEVL